MGDVLDLRLTITGLLEEQLEAVDDASAAESRLLMDGLEVLRSFKRIPDEKATRGGKAIACVYGLNHFSRLTRIPANPLHRTSTRTSRSVAA